MGCRALHGACADTKAADGWIERPEKDGQDVGCKRPRPRSEDFSSVVVLVEGG